MGRYWDSKRIPKDHLEFIYVGKTKSGKTKVWIVRSKYAPRPVLGRIKWYGGWRKYVFFPESETHYDVNCLKTIADFIKNEMDKRKAKR